MLKVNETLEEIREIAHKLLTYTEWTSVEEVEGHIARIYNLASELTNGEETK